MACPESLVPAGAFMGSPYRRGIWGRSRIRGCSALYAAGARGGGIALGITQFFALRQALSKPILWIAIAAIGWYLDFQLGFAIYSTPGDYPLLSASIIYGGITGLALKFLLVPASPPVPRPRKRWADLSPSRKILLVILSLLSLVVLFILMIGMFGLG